MSLTCNKKSYYEVHIKEKNHEICELHYGFYVSYANEEKPTNFIGHVTKKRMCGVCNAIRLESLQFNVKTLLSSNYSKKILVKAGDKYEQMR